MKESTKLRSDYDAVGKSREKQAEFRADWAEKTHLEYTKKLQRIRESSKCWRKVGKYLTLARMAWKEGGGTAGWKVATNQALAAMSVGWPWYEWDSRGKTYRYLWFEKSFEETFKESYRIHEEWKQSMEDEKAPAIEDEKTPPGKPARNAKAKADGRPSPTEPPAGKKPRTGPADPEKPEKPEKPGTSTLADSFTKAKDMKKTYAAVTSAAMTIQPQLKKNKAWSWCVEAKMHKTMDKAFDEVNEKVGKDDFVSKFLQQEAGQFSKTKKDVSVAGQEVKYEKFIHDMDTPLLVLKKAVDKLNGQRAIEMDENK